MSPCCNALRTINNFASKSGARSPAFVFASCVSLVPLLRELNIQELLKYDECKEDRGLDMELHVGNPPRLRRPKCLPKEDRILVSISLKACRL